MTSEPRAFLAFDLGAASISATLVGRVGGHWRLVGSLVLPAGPDPDTVAAALAVRLAEADPALAASIAVSPGGVAELPRLTVSSSRPRRLAVIAATDRSLTGLVSTADRSGWRTTGASVESTDPLAMTRLLMDADVGAILVGAGDPAAADERRALAELAAVVASAVSRRPEVTAVLAGAMGEQRDRFGDSDRSGEVILAPAVARNGGPDPLGDLLLELALPADDPRRTLAATAVSLAEILDRRVDVIDIGYDAGTRIAAWPAAGTRSSGSSLAVVPSACLAPADPDDAVIERVGHWSMSGADRHRLRDRMRELRIAPWSDPTEDGVNLRLAAARAALTRLVDRTPGWAERPPADVVIAAGGAWSIAPGPVTALALSDVLRRHGASQYGLDHARALAPFGAIPDSGERRGLLTDLIDDLVAPLGTVVTPSGMRVGRPAGSVVVRTSAGETQLDLAPGGLAVIDLPPGVAGVAEFRFRDTVRLGGRGRHFVVDVSGGLGGLLVDLRDVPLRLPDRADLRADLLETWRTAVAGRTG